MTAKAASWLSPKTKAIFSKITRNKDNGSYLNWSLNLTEFVIADNVQVLMQVIYKIEKSLHIFLKEVHIFFSALWLFEKWNDKLVIILNWVWINYAFFESGVPLIRNGIYYVRYYDLQKIIWNEWASGWFLTWAWGFWKLVDFNSILKNGFFSLKNFKERWWHVLIWKSKVY